MELKQENTVNKHSPEFVDKVFWLIVILALVVLALAGWYKYKYNQAIIGSGEQENYIIQLEKNKEKLLEELDKYKQPLH